MAATYYAQSDHVAPTMTVGDLIERLKAFDPAAPVIFRSPLYGSFGSNTAYSIDKVEHVALEREEIHTPAHEHFNEEDGETCTVEAETQVFNAWAGVVIG